MLQPLFQLLAWKIRTASALWSLPWLIWTQSGSYLSESAIFCKAPYYRTEGYSTSSFQEVLQEKTVQTLWRCGGFSFQLDVLNSVTCQIKDCFRGKLLMVGWFLPGAMLQLLSNGKRGGLESVRIHFISNPANLESLLRSDKALSSDITCRAFEAFHFGLEFLNFRLQCEKWLRHTSQSGLSFQFLWLGILHARHVVIQSKGKAVALDSRLFNNVLRLRSVIYSSRSLLARLANWVFSVYDVPTSSCGRDGRAFYLDNVSLLYGLGSQYRCA